MNPNDQMRRQILQYFYDRNAGATSKMGKKGSSVKISDVKRELKEKCGLSQPQVVSNLNYLLDNGWVKSVEVQKTIQVRGGTIPQVTTSYEISAKGIDKIEGGSQFEPQDKYPGINISATGQNVITLGDGNVVNAEYSELRERLDNLKNAISVENRLTDSQKLDASVDIESIKDQLAKRNPNKSAIARLWEGIQKLETIASLGAAVGQIVPLIRTITG
jgi:predicted transcriptional regulator